MKKFKSFIALLFSVLMIAGCIPNEVFAETAVPSAAPAVIDLTPYIEASKDAVLAAFPYVEIVNYNNGAGTIYSLIPTAEFDFNASGAVYSIVLTDTTGSYSLGGAQNWQGSAANAANLAANGYTAIGQNNSSYA